MTEAEWLTCTTAAEEMWRHLKVSQRAARTKSGRRKFRLWTAACFCNHLNVLERINKAKPPVAVLHEAVAVVERFADGLATEDELREMHTTMHQVKISHITMEFVSTHIDGALASTRQYYVGVKDELLGGTDRMRVARLREIFGNPFRPITVNPSWLTSNVIALASGIYEEKAFDRMPILADALQDAGCDNTDILDHCRDPNAVHVRGCWVVDHLLGLA